MPTTSAKRLALLVNLSLLVFVALQAAAAPAPASAPGKHVKPGNFDIRVNGAKEYPQALSAPHAKSQLSKKAVITRTEAIVRAADALQQRVPGATVRFSPLTGGPEVVRVTKAPLTAASTASSLDTVRAYLHQNKAVYGLTDAEIDALVFLGESVSPKSGLRMVRLDQRVGGVSVFQSQTRFLLDRNGRIVRSVGLFVPGITNPPSPTPTVSATAALAAAFVSVGIKLDPTVMTTHDTSAGGTRTVVRPNQAGIVGDVDSSIVYFPLAPGVVVPAWRQIAYSTDADWMTIVDATSGKLLWRKNIRSNATEARFDVYVKADGKTPNSPAPLAPTNVTPGSGTQAPGISRTIVAMNSVIDNTASPDGWIPTGGTTTTGNNVDAYLDTNADNAPDTGLLDNNGRPVGALDISSNLRDFLGPNFAYNPPPFGGNPDAGDSPTGDTYRRGVVTQLFYITNWYHDRLYEYGFNEGAGNFQTNNFGNGGTGGDPVLAEAQDGSGTDNANFSTPPDGSSGRMQMYIFDFPTPNRDGILDPDIVVHELTHGLSNRLIGDSNGLIWDEGGGMGEGWSDFYALSLLHGSNAEDPNGKYASGAYATYQFLGLTDNYLYGIRRFPYSTDNTVNPLTWADVDDTTANMSGGIAVSPVGFEFGGALEVHNVGEIWALTLWEVRSRVIADPAGANGDVPTGNDTMLQLVTDALKMTPINPSFTDARDAIIDADCATNACANEASIWAGFADRGLGYGAVAPLGQSGILSVGGHVGIGESFVLPYLDVNTVTIDDSNGNNNGAIDPGEPILLTVNLKNPWRNASKAVASVAGVLSTSTSGVTVVTANASWGGIAAAGNGSNTTPFLFLVPASATCGQSIVFSLQTTSSLGTTTASFRLRVGTASGTGAPVTYSASPALAIPDNNLLGVTSTLNIPDDYEISNVDFRLDSLTHTFTGDLAVGFYAPNGYGTDLAFLRGIFIGDADGDNFTNTVFTDSSVNDLNLSGAADAPFTGDWLPAFNSPIWSLFGIPNLGPDPVGQLSRMNLPTSAGTWKVHATDEAQADTGTLNQYSIIITPTAFTCAAFVPSVTIAATKTVAGAFSVGGTVTYTVTITNNGTAIQGDNPGNEFTDVLPASLTLVSANATSGTAVATVATRTVTWNGSLAPLGGSVTITITATINAGTQGSLVSNQGSVSYDSDGNGTNESTTSTDDPGLAGKSDPTSFTVAPGALVTATKTFTGTRQEGTPLTYTIVLTNSGGAAQADNPGNEFTDVLPAGLTLVSATATSGTAVATIASGTVTWNGGIPAGGSVTITVNTTIKPGTIGTTITNQGQFVYDADANGTNESSGSTDDPAVTGAANPTSFIVLAAGGAVSQIPAVGNLGLLLVGLLLGLVGFMAIRR